MAFAAFGTTAEPGSKTVPVIVPWSVWAMANEANSTNGMLKRNKAARIVIPLSILDCLVTRDDYGLLPDGSYEVPSFRMSRGVEAGVKPTHAAIGPGTDILGRGPWRCIAVAASGSAI